MQSSEYQVTYGSWQSEATVPLTHGSVSAADASSYAGGHRGGNYQQLGSPASPSPLSGAHGQVKLTSKGAMVAAPLTAEEAERRLTAEMLSQRRPSLRSWVWRELGLLFGMTTMVVFQVLGKLLLEHLEQTVKAVVVFIWLFVAILTLAFGVVRHADCLAVLLGEPYGTLILTISVIGIEAAMLANLMLTGEDNPTLARDTMFSVIMIVLTGIVGLGLLLGGLRNRQHLRVGAEQEFNLRGALSYLRVLIPMATLSLVVPRFTNEKGGQVSTTLGVWLLCMSAVLYGVFLFLQTTTHAVFFEQPTPLVGPPELDLAGDGAEGGRHGLSGNGLQPGDAGVASMPPPPRGTADDRYDLDSAEPHSRRRNHRGSIVGVGKEQAPSSAHGGGSLHAGLVVKVRSNPPDVSFLAGIYLCNVRALVAGLRRRRGSAQTTPYHATLLFVTMVPVVLLAKSMAKMIKYGTVKTGAPQELGGFLVAVLVLSPEGITAIKAALVNQLQRTVNIALGSATSTIGMTIPVALFIAFVTGKDIELGLTPLQIAELTLTLITSSLTFVTGKTNYLQGVVHLSLFVTYVFLVFDKGA